MKCIQVKEQTEMYFDVARYHSYSKTLLLTDTRELLPETTRECDIRSWLSVVVIPVFKLDSSCQSWYMKL